MSSKSVLTVILVVLGTAHRGCNGRRRQRAVSNGKPFEQRKLQFREREYLHHLGDPGALLLDPVKLLPDCPALRLIRPRVERDDVAGGVNGCAGYFEHSMSPQDRQSGSPH